MSDDDFEDSFNELDESEDYINEDEKSEVYAKSDKINNLENKETKKLFHFLPFKIPYSGPCNVNVYFDSLIEPRKGNISNSDECVTSFRGKILNGKKIKVTDQNFSFCKINLANVKGTQKIQKIEDINEYYVWKFDEEIPHDSNLANMSNLLKCLNILK